MELLCVISEALGRLQGEVLVVCLLQEGGEACGALGLVLTDERRVLADHSANHLRDQAEGGT